MNENENKENTGKFYFIGNLLCLDFINTQIVADGQSVDLLSNREDFTDWLTRAGVLAESEARSFPAIEMEALTEIRAFRAVLRDLAAAIAEEKAISVETIAEINRWLARRNLRLTLEKTETGYAKVSHSLWADGLDALAPIAESAADLLASGDLTLLRKCENSQCVLYFYDTTKNHARRWCSMSGCGNRHKVGEYYKRKKAGAA